VSQQHISNIERGKWMPQPDTLDELLQHCGCQLVLRAVPLLANSSETSATGGQSLLFGRRVPRRDP
jgi:transcriptional regulator with XRE-family HTH domain